MAVCKRWLLTREFLRVRAYCGLRYTLGYPFGPSINMVLVSRFPGEKRQRKAARLSFIQAGRPFCYRADQYASAAIASFLAASVLGLSGAGFTFLSSS